ncbi:hypothetical protein BDN72DRAFT_157446 [Pluteus cervinus]|uniref:Uncharacterized protein n=1 Tax=Pluteus cervinus TaxID=181527 RepID=A0ACD3AMR6_9AGAR|nr:hypothetical protein BDN72DRAFT_157446 [Pluteus cervinus]
MTCTIRRENATASFQLHWCSHHDSLLRNLGSRRGVSICHQRKLYLPCQCEKVGESQRNVGEYLNPSLNLTTPQHPFLPPSFFSFRAACSLHDISYCRDGRSFSFRFGPLEALSLTASWCASGRTLPANPSHQPHHDVESMFWLLWFLLA